MRLLVFAVFIVVAAVAALPLRSELSTKHTPGTHPISKREVNRPVQSGLTQPMRQARVSKFSRHPVHYWVGGPVGA